MFSEQTDHGAVPVLHEIMLDDNYFSKKYYKTLRNSLGTYPNKNDAQQIGSAPSFHLTNVCSRDTRNGKEAQEL